MHPRSMWDSGNKDGAPVSELALVAIPNGVGADGVVTVRVLVVPRLAEGSIEDFGLADWPDVLNGDARFSIAAKGADGTVTEHRAALVSSARLDVWRGFFAAGGGAIDPWRADGPTGVDALGSYDASRRVMRTYRSLVMRCAMKGVDTAQITRQELLTWTNADEGPPSGSGTGSAPAIPDFHRTISMLRQHPRVLRALGMIFDLRLGSTDLVLDGASERALSIRCTDPPFLQALVSSPWTKYDLTQGRFVPDSTGSTLGVFRGMLDLSGAQLVQPSSASDLVDPKQAEFSPWNPAIRDLDAPALAPAEAEQDPPWALTTFDADGAASALRQAARSKNPEVAPAVRTLGIGLLRPSRGSDLAAILARASDRKATLADTELDADDLVLGYRVDVNVNDGDWLSVNGREAIYTVGVPIGGEWVMEEGQFNAMTAVKDGDSLHADELVLHWDGWSTAVPVINFVDEPVGDSSFELPPDYPYEFRWEHRIKDHTLPRLRFSNRYRIRVRIADLAGGGLPTGGVTDTADVASRDFHYRRYEPVPPPRLIATARLSVGTAVDRLVVRSDRDLTPEQLQQAFPHYPRNDVRSLITPLSPLELVEQHGFLDGKPDDLTWNWVQRVIGPQDPEHPRPGLPDPAANGVSAVIQIEPGGTPRELSDRKAWTGRWPDPVAKKITLIGDPRPDADPVAMDFQTDDLRITLAKGEQATVALSSTIRSGLQAHLAMFDVLDSSEDLLSHTTSGRNPIVTPVRDVLLVHAVRKPLSDPKWTLPPAAITRNINETSVLLTPKFLSTIPGVPGLNTDSTGRLDVTAAWTDVVDVGDVASTIERKDGHPHLFSATINRGEPPTLSIRHEFGNTKHRLVTYTLDAITRFRQYFEPSESSKLFHASLTQEPVSVLSSAQPAPLTILGVVPSFAWQPIQIGTDRIEHVRRAQRIRVELARPWYLTGAGECIGVVLPAAGVGAASPADRYVTKMGRDPLFGTPDTARYPGADWFVGRSGDAATLQLPGIPNQTVVVVPHRPVAAGDRWVADIRLAPPANQASYNPLVELALVRYQPSSVPGQHLSSVAFADKVPLLPDRRVVVDRVGNQIRVTVSGLGPTQGNRVEAVLEQAPTGGVASALVSTPGATDGVAAWSAVGAGASGQLGSMLSLTLPATNRSVRLRVTESEPIADAPNPSPISDLARRVVFLDTITLPEGWRT